MSRQQKKPLVDAFPGSSNNAARRVAETIWDGEATRAKIERVYEQLKEDQQKPTGIQGIAERAARFMNKFRLPPAFKNAASGLDHMGGSSGSTGRPFKPFIALRSAMGWAAPALEPR